MAACASLGAAAQSCQALGPEGGSAQTLVAEPGDSGRVFAISYGTLFVSDDVGRNWRASNPGRKFSGPISTYAPSPARYLAIDYDSRLLRSEDHGETWTPTGHSFAGANVDKLVVTADGALYSGYQGGVGKSLDGGVTWNALDHGLPPPMQFNRLNQVRKIAFDARSCAAPPAAGACATGPLNTVFAVSNGLINDESYRVIKSTQGGAYWMPLPALPPHLWGDDWSESVAPSDIEVETSTSTIYIPVFATYDNYDGSPRVPSIDAGVFRSDDGGATWVHAANGLPLVPGSATTTQDVFALALHPRRAGVLWASVSTAGGASRIYTSTDSGTNWSAVGPALTDCDVRDLQVDTAAPAVIYAAGLALNGSVGCVRRSEDGGQTWQSLSADLPVTTVFNVRQDSQDRRRLVLATENGVWETIAPSDKIFTDTGD